MVNDDCLHLAGPGVVDEWAKWMMQEVAVLDADLERVRLAPENRA
jgi:hypothetical protein